MTRPPLQPETIDIDILREMYREGAIELAGVDPRLNVTRIARQLGVRRPRVADRLKAWSESGLLRQYDVWVNPALFGWQGAGVSIRVQHPGAKAELFSRLAALEGAVSAVEFLGEWITFGVVTPNGDALERTLKVIRGLTGVREVDEPAPWIMLPPNRVLSPLDIRIVRALRENPTAMLSTTAGRVGISTRTMTRRYANLVENRDVWFVPIFDFRAFSFPVVLLGVKLRAETDRNSILRRIRTRYPLSLAFRGMPERPGLDAGRLLCLVMPASAAHLEELELYVASIEGVEGLEANVVVRLHSFPDWFDRQLEALARRRS
ncbi:MAG: Lrp/AsnC family transcriptional regulator [Thermoplasmata archaeon]